MQRIDDQDSGYAGLRRILVKHMMADARDCWIAWKADFSRMEITLLVDLISPALLTDFLMALPRYDECFVKTELTEVVQISNRFNIKVIVATEAGEVQYKLRAYRLIMPRDKSGRPEIELLPLAQAAHVQHVDAQEIMREIDIEELALKVFGNKGKAHAWLSSYHLTLGATPAAMLGTEEGRDEVRKMLVAIAAGGVA